MNLLPPRSTSTDTLVPYPTLCRAEPSAAWWSWMRMPAVSACWSLCSGPHDACDRFDGGDPRRIMAHDQRSLAPSPASGAAHRMAAPGGLPGLPPTLADAAGRGAGERAAAGGGGAGQIGRAHV